MLDVCLLGCGGMMPLPHRWLTSCIMRYNGSSLLIDCGEGTQIAIKSAGLSCNPIDTICFTHYHADHISGLPGLLLDMANSDRSEPITIIGPRGLARVVNSLRVIAPELPYEIEFCELTEPASDIILCGYHIHAFKVNHNVTCYGYSVSIPRAGKFNVEAAKSLGLPVQLWNPLQKGNTVTHEGRTYTPNMVMGQDRRGLKVTYCTDSRPTKGIVEAARDSDIFICEGMYGDPEKASDAKKKKHMTFYEAAALARDANVSQLWLTHYSPSLVGPKRYLNEVRKIFANTYTGKDGKRVELDFDED